MASIFRQTYTRVGRKGERIRRKSKKWYIEYRDSAGRTVRIPGFVDKKATAHLAAKLETEAERIRAGMLPADVRQLVRPFAEHLREFVAYLAAKPASAGHVEKSRRRIERIAADLAIERISDVTAQVVSQWLAARRADGMATETSNHYLRAVKAMFAWLTREGRVEKNPLAALKCANAEVDRRVVRRTLTDAEFAHLLAVVRQSGAVHMLLTGPQRHALYATAAYTGLRARELASLTAASLDFAAMTITVDAPNSKRRTRDVLPMHPDLVPILNPLVVGASPLWPGRDWPRSGAEMLARDLAEAGIAREVDGARFDFHALRSQFVTSLIRAGVPLAAVQRLARHSTPVLTANLYTRLRLADLADGVARLPSLTGGAGDCLQAAGADRRASGDNR